MGLLDPKMNYKLVCWRMYKCVDTLVAIKLIQWIASTQFGKQLLLMDSYTMVPLWIVNLFLDWSQVPSYVEMTSYRVLSFLEVGWENQFDRSSPRSMIFYKNRFENWLSSNKNCLGQYSHNSFLCMLWTLWGFSYVFWIYQCFGLPTRNEWYFSRTTCNSYRCFLGWHHYL